MELGEEPRVEVAAKIMQEICYEYRDSLMADIILCGWDKYKGGQVMHIWFILLHEWFAWKNQILDS